MPQANDHQPKRLARLAAVQGLYQMALTQRAAKIIIKDFWEQPSTLLGETSGATAPEGIDRDIFNTIVLGVEQNAQEVDGMVAGCLDAKLSIERIEILLRAILRAGAYELHHHASISSGIIINDYVDITHAFFGAKEPGFVNAVLDKLAKTLRS